MNFSQLIAHPEWLLIVLAPIFFVCIALEWYIGNRKQQLPPSAQYHQKEVLCNMALASLHQVADITAGLFISKVYLLFFGWKLFDIEMNWATFILLMVAQDFCYYWFHRASHRVRWLWAAHVVHHSSENMNFSTAFRQSLMYPIAGMWLFWLPLVILGFDPNYVVFAVLLNLGLQFFVHTQAIKSIGPLEYIFNSPAHHRVHHGKNPQYIDKNYAGVLIIWDKLFGSFEPEVETVQYGVTKPVNSFNPLTVTFAEWREMWREQRQSELTLRQRLKLIFAPPASQQINKKGS
ncbi:sterol desaturase family protein [Shewanella marina]|uniref:sterol desaturase family protein n=1 Tax=Shewanella marina TaxID=487319 RepID=UPI000471492D|nr:sterol desaturase family protein [Shewanella marina]